MVHFQGGYPRGGGSSLPSNLPAFRCPVVLVSAPFPTYPKWWVAKQPCCQTDVRFNFCVYRKAFKEGEAAGRVHPRADEEGDGFAEDGAAYCEKVLSATQLLRPPGCVRLLISVIGVCCEIQISKIAQRTSEKNKEICVKVRTNVFNCWPFSLKQSSSISDLLSFYWVRPELRVWVSHSWGTQHQSSQINWTYWKSGWDLCRFCGGFGQRCRYTIFLFSWSSLFPVLERWIFVLLVGRHKYTETHEVLHFV